MNSHTREIWSKSLILRVMQQTFRYEKYGKFFSLQLRFRAPHVAKARYLSPFDFSLNLTRLQQKVLRPWFPPVSTNPVRQVEYARLARASQVSFWANKGYLIKVFTLSKKSWKHKTQCGLEDLLVRCIVGFAAL